MKQIVIQAGRVIAYHEAGQQIAARYPANEGYRIALYDGELDGFTDGLSPEPSADKIKRWIDNGPLAVAIANSPDALCRLIRAMRNDRRNGTDTFSEMIDNIEP